jgi:L-iditol 2-dehydrogenase
MNNRKNTMHALVLEAYNALVYKEMPIPEMSDHGVLIQVKACGICGSDVHGIDGSTGRRIPPIIMGHEAAGVIVEIGSGVQGFTTGERVTFDSTVYCGHCCFCRQGLINLCDNRRVLGVSCNDYRQHGAFAEYVAVPAHILYRLPETVTFEQAAMVEPVSIAVHAVSITPVTLNDTAVVVGSGMIGLLVIQALRASGCGQVIAVDIDSQKLDRATQAGATAVYNAKEVDVPAAVQHVTDGHGADLAIEVVGNTAAVNTAIHSVKKGGYVTIIGNLSPTIDLPLQAVVTRQIRVQGSCASNGEYPACLDMIANNTITVDMLMSKIAPLAEGAEWFKRLYQGEAGLMKVILKP